MKIRTKLWLLVVACPALALLGAAPAFGEEWGNLKAKFVLDGPAPTPAKLKIDKDVDYCGRFNLVDEATKVGKNGELADVVIYLQKKPAKVHPNFEAGLKEEVKIDNAKCRFAGHVTFVRTGHKLVIGNSDPIGHNTKADFFYNPSFNILIPAKGNIAKTFQKAESTPSLISCNIHPWMTGRLLILDHPYAGISNEKGELEIKNLPVGKHTFTVWHEPKFVTNLGGKALKRGGKWDVEIKAGDNDLGTLKVKQ